jgi:uncharacterized membrane protein
MVNLKVYALGSNIADLGFYVNNIANSFYDYKIIFIGHVQPLLAVFSVFLIFIPTEYKDYFLVNIQYFIILYTSLILYTKYKPIYSLILILFYPIWINALFDFHPDILILPLMAYLYYYNSINKINRILICGLLICFIKEPYALITAFFGLFILIEQIRIQNKKMIFAGIYLIIMGLLWFIVSICFILPNFNNNYGAISSNAFNWLIDIKYNHLYDYIINSINYSKIKFILLPLILFIFIPLINIKYIIPVIPIFGIAMLSSNPNYYNTFNHYSLPLVVPIIAATYFYINDKPQLKKILNLIIFLNLISFIIFTSSPISRLFWSDKVYEYSWKNYYLDDRKNSIKNAINKYLSNDKSSSVSVQNNIHLSVISDRKYLYIFPQGVLYDNNKNYGNIKDGVIAKYVLIDNKIPIFVYADGCTYLFGECTNQTIKNQYNSIVDGLNLHYNLVYSEDGFNIYKLKF